MYKKKLILIFFVYIICQNLFSQVFYLPKDCDIINKDLGFFINSHTKLEDLEHEFNGFMIIKLDTSNILSGHTLMETEVFWIEQLSQITDEKKYYWYLGFPMMWSASFSVNPSKCTNALQCEKISSFVQAYRIINENSDCKSYLYLGQNITTDTLFNANNVWENINGDNLFIYKTSFSTSILHVETDRINLRFFLPISKLRKFEEIDESKASEYGLIKNSNIRLVVK